MKNRENYKVSIIIPVYNEITLLKLSGMNWWWIFVLYATTFIYDDQVVVGIDYLMSDKNKVEAIKKINSDFIYILPSSIHEVIVVNPNYTEIKESEITEMVRNINTTLDPDIVLSDSVYKYFGKGKWEVIS